MSTPQITVHGYVRHDGTLHVEEKVDLPPGPVHVTVAAAGAEPRESTPRLLLEIVAGRESPGRMGGTKEEIDAAIDTMRDEDEQRMLEIERLYQESRFNKD